MEWSSLVLSLLKEYLSFKVRYVILYHNKICLGLITLNKYSIKLNGLICWYEASLSLLIRRYSYSSISTTHIYTFMRKASNFLRETELFAIFQCIQVEFPCLPSF